MISSYRIARIAQVKVLEITQVIQQALSTDKKDRKYVDRILQYFYFLIINDLVLIATKYLILWSLPVLALNKMLTVN
jgi:hypothetical protein